MIIAAEALELSSFTDIRTIKPLLQGLSESKIRTAAFVFLATNDSSPTLAIRTLRMSLVKESGAQRIDFFEVIDAGDHL